MAKKMIIDSTLQTKALRIDKQLCQAYGAPFRYFGSKDALSQMVSSILSHRTKNATTKKAYTKLKETFPTWEAVRDAPVNEIQQCITLSTYSEVKAQRIKDALRIISNANFGRLSLDFLKEMSVSDARAWVEKIPGVGVKTSAAILNFSNLRMPALVVDTHHHRVAQRIGIIPPKCSLDKGAALLEAYLPSDWDSQRVYDSHQAYMRHGQKACHHYHPDCKNCIISDQCDFFNSNH